MTWGKGKSGNPKGRKPEDSSEIRDLARKHCPEAIRKLVEWMKSDNPKASVAACNAILDRGWGKPAQTVDLGDKTNQALTAVLQIVSGKGK